MAVAVRMPTVNGSTGARLFDRIYVWCPGCDQRDPGHSGLHAFNVPTEGSVEQAPVWTFDGNLEAPSFEPSMKVTYRRGDVDLICHSFLRLGVWEFLADSTAHTLRGFVPLPQLPDWVTRQAAGVAEPPA